MIDRSLLKKLKNYNGSKYYNGRSAWDSNAHWITVLSPRNDGKSLWFTIECIIDFFKNNHMLAYVRRHDGDIKNRDVTKYFSDPNLIKWLNGIGYSSIKCIFSEIWIMKRNENGKEEKAELLGYPFAVSTQDGKKSLHYGCHNYIFEEFITLKNYLPDELTEFSNIISTASRSGSFRAILLGNTIARNCPYLLDMGIDLMKAKQGNLYKLKLKQKDGTEIDAVFDYVKPTEKRSFFFGKAEKNIVHGEFTADIMPHLFFKLDAAELLSECIFITDMRRAYHVKRLLYNDKKYLYVYPMDYDEVRFEFCDVFANFEDYEHDYYYRPKKRSHRHYAKLLKEGTLFSDNLTGTEFKQALRKHNPFT